MIRTFNSDEELRSVLAEPSNTKFAFIIIGDKYAVGIDLKFKDGASVFVFGER